MWKASINGDIKTLEILEQKFSSYIVKDNNYYFLTCPQFENLEEQEVFRLAQEKLKQMLDLLNLYVDIDLSVHISTLINKQGNNTNVASNVKLGASVKLAKITQTVDGVETVIYPKADDDLENLHNCIINHENIQDALHFYEDPNWVNLFKIWELIEEDIGGKSEIVNKGWANGDEIDLFRCTAHNREGAGLNARHGPSKLNPHCSRVLSSQDPMQLSVAKSLITRILKQWIDFKCN